MLDIWLNYNFNVAVFAIDESTSLQTPHYCRATRYYSAVHATVVMKKIIIIRKFITRTCSQALSMNRMRTERWRTSQGRRQSRTLEKWQYLGNGAKQWRCYYRLLIGSHIITYRIPLFLMTLSDLQDQSPVAWLFEWDLSLACGDT